MHYLSSPLRLSLGILTTMESLKTLSPFYDAPEFVYLAAPISYIEDDVLTCVSSSRYKQRLNKDYRIPQVTLKQIHTAVPKELYQKSTLKGLSYVARDIAFASLFYVSIPPSDSSTPLI